MDFLLISKFLSKLLYPVGLMTCLLLAGLLMRASGHKKSGITMLFMSITILIASSLPGVSYRALSYLERQFLPVSINEQPYVPVIVLLGNNLAMPKEPRLNTEMTQTSDRLLHTFRLFKAGKADRIFISGGNVFGDYHQRGEAHYSKQLLIEWGIPESVIDIETQSRSTRDNALQTYDYLLKKQLLNQPFLLVTSASHMPRAHATFRALNLDAVPATTDITITQSDRPTLFYWLPSVEAIVAMTTFVHEYVGLMFYRVRHWAI